jgi:hypothetical protein
VAVTGNPEMVDTYGKLRSRLRQTIGMLAVQFLLGMAANLIGTPSETSGSTKVIATTFVILHIAVAIGIVVYAVIISRDTRKMAKSLYHLANYAAAAVAASFIAGIFTVITQSNWWSYAMAIGFIIVILQYFTIYARAPGAPVEEPHIP